MVVYKNPQEWIAFLVGVWYNGEGDENGSEKGVAAEKTVATEKLRLQQAGCVFHNDMHPQQKTNPIPRRPLQGNTK